jgi:ABC-2 type transport system permease protein
MSLWRLEWLRLVRTRRLLVLLAVFVFFGLTGPLSARYLTDILNRVGGGIRVELPPPAPADGFAQFTGNAAQIGVLVVVLVAASALALDARPEVATFLRTRVTDPARLILPAYLMTTTAAVAAVVAGCGAAWYETTVLLGGSSAGRVLLGTAMTAAFFAFAVAATTLAAYVVRSVLATAGVTVVLLLSLALAGNLPGVRPWLPSTLLSALPGLVAGQGVGDFLKASAVALAATLGCLALAVRLAARRELSSITGIHKGVTR